MSQYNRHRGGGEQGLHTAPCVVKACFCFQPLSQPGHVSSGARGGGARRAEDTSTRRGTTEGAASGTRPRAWEATGVPVNLQPLCWKALTPETALQDGTAPSVTDAWSSLGGTPDRHVEPAGLQGRGCRRARAVSREHGLSAWRRGPGHHVGPPGRASGQ